MPCQIPEFYAHSKAAARIGYSTQANDLELCTFLRATTLPALSQPLPPCLKVHVSAPKHSRSTPSTIPFDAVAVGGGHAARLSRDIETNRLIYTRTEACHEMPHGEPPCRKPPHRRTQSSSKGRPMRATLSDLSAVTWWLTNTAYPDNLRPFDGSILAESTPHVSSFAFLESALPLLPRPVHLLSSHQRHDRGGRWKCHTTSYPFPCGSFLQISSELYIASPELSFIQSCRTLPTHQALKVGSALCGSFRLDSNAQSGLHPRPPLGAAKTCHRIRL